MNQLRAICLSLPETTELETWGDPTFRVCSKIFALFRTGAGRHSVWMKAAPGVQDVLVSVDPERFFVPPYVGHNGWIGVRLDVPVDWDELTDLVTDSYRLVAPKRLSAVI
jgi:predicted DNA-binding protein (MmcQ/YjbR family)